MKTLLLLVPTLLFCLIAQAQTGSVRGTVFSAQHQPVEFANVTLKSTSLGSSTGEDGKFSINDVPVGNYTLVVSSIGYTTTTRSVTVSADQSSLVDFVLAESSEQLQEVEITGRKERAYKNTSSFAGTKTETPLKLVPQAISYVTKEVIDDQQAFKTSDVLKNLSGVNVFSFYNNDFSLRGFRASNALINGLRDPTNSWGQSLLPNVERVEVIKGPASALFANSDPGGTVNTVTKKPLDESRKAMSFATGSFNTFRIAGDFTGPLDEEKTLLYRLNMAYQNAQSFRYCKAPGHSHRSLQSLFQRIAPSQH